jgi:hypothetical protein
VQTILAEVHGRNSCSYDPANFGWSSNLPATEADFYGGFEPLLDQIGRRDEPKIFIGWLGGNEPAFKHAVELPSTKGLVLLDPGPYGIEWLDLQREKNWTTDQMLAYKDFDMRSRIELAKTILMLAIPWFVSPS